VPAIVEAAMKIIESKLLIKNVTSQDNIKEIINKKLAEVAGNIGASAIKQMTEIIFPHF
jgi:ABC-type sulfate transport system permease component